MTRRRTRAATAAVAVLAALAIGAAACSSSGEVPLAVATTTTTTVAPPSTTTAAPLTTTTTTVPPTTTTAAPPSMWAAVPTSGPVKAIVTASGIVLPVLSQDGGGYVVQTPCSKQATVPVSGATPLRGADIVLDPGHGGDEPGAVGPNGLTEKALNLAVVLDVQRILQDAGATVIVTRTADYRVTLSTRGLIATNLQPMAFVSLHHNAEPDGPHAGPGTETYYQIASASSKRLAGLIYEEVVAALSPYDLAWVGDTDAGAKYRLSSSGGDYYGILSHAAGVTSVLSELGFISDPPEAALLATPAYQQVEAAAVARGIIRYVSTDDPGSGYVTPYPRTEPAGSGGGTTGCVDPPL